ncbi:hypothetical protein BGW80DRAFT_1295731 [Lactifluus volemus]|nr:hypothetical protein BGW80DRAFT_1295731 [Lactifluus volemus]
MVSRHFSALRRAARTAATSLASGSCWRRICVVRAPDTSDRRCNCHHRQSMPPVVSPFIASASATCIHLSAFVLPLPIASNLECLFESPSSPNRQLLSLNTRSPSAKSLLHPHLFANIFPLPVPIAAAPVLIRPLIQALHAFPILCLFPRTPHLHLRHPHP